MRKIWCMVVRKLAAIVSAGFAVGTVVGVLFEIYAISDLWRFELPYIISMFGLSGILIISLMNAGFLVLTWHFFRHGSVFVKGSTLAGIFLILWCFVMLWFVDWMFVPNPLTLRLRLLFRDSVGVAGYHPKADVGALGAFMRDRSPAFPDQLGIMLDRIIVNNPPLYSQNGVAATILKYSRRYNVDPILLFYLNYIDSWYGKGPSGPIPFFSRMTPATVRKLIQVHLPTMMVESPIRVYLASTNFYQYFLGDSFIAWQLREFAHKFTLDASVSPYALNTFSDVLLVMKEYPSEFRELSTDLPGDGLSEALHHAFVAIAPTTLRKPYEEPYEHPSYGSSYYHTYRGDLKKFARAVFYKLIFDFEFGTKVQALRIKYDEQILRNAVGEEPWHDLDNKQKLAMLSMSRDMFTPNVGRLGENLYTLCEINCTPIAFRAAEATRELGVIKTSDNIWRPREYQHLYAGAGYRLRVLSEVWQAFYGAPLPGLQPTDTVGESLRIVE
jgi:hypothetical protein